MASSRSAPPPGSCQDFHNRDHSRVICAIATRASTRSWSLTLESSASAGGELSRGDDVALVAEELEDFVGPGQPQRQRRERSAFLVGPDAPGSDLGHHGRSLEVGQ